ICILPVETQNFASWQNNKETQNFASWQNNKETQNFASWQNNKETQNFASLQIPSSVYGRKYNLRLLILPLIEKMLMQKSKNLMSKNTINTQSNYDKATCN
ncbi:MAG: hypothetical protein ABII74_00050, partial [Elusimicrobiota bacterium]